MDQSFMPRPTKNLSLKSLASALGLTSLPQKPPVKPAASGNGRPAKTSHSRLLANPFLNPHLDFKNLHSKAQTETLTRWFYQSDIGDYQRLLKTTPETTWQQLGQQKALNLFHQAATNIPAYQDFLKKHRVKPELVKTFSDFQQLPSTDKPTYIDNYPLEKLCWHGRLDQANIVSYSSGSTGTPYLWPRGVYQDFEGAFLFEHLLTSLYHVDKKSTLLVNCFSMGNYVAGVYVYTSAKLASQKGYPLTVVSPGLNYQDIFDMLEQLAGKYDQIILAGYPPFIRDVLELGLNQGLDLRSLNLKFFFASEFFSETWRDQTLSLVGNHQPLTSSTNIYGTADSAIFSFETPTAILIRQLLQRRPKLNQALFASKLTPTLTQYNPLLTFYESINRELTLTANSGLCLLRYNLKDQGDLLSNADINSTFAAHKLDLDAKLRAHQLSHTRQRLPFVYLTNRTDGAVSFYGIKIFPEYFRSGIDSECLRPHLTGKFSLVSAHNRRQQPELTVHVELKTAQKPDKALNQEVFQKALESLRQHCSEFSFLEASIGSKAHPKIKLHPKGTSEYFQVKIKQRWITS
jgi:phenylacetate-CoA ligase